MVQIIEKKAMRKTTKYVMITVSMIVLLLLSQKAKAEEIAVYDTSTETSGTSYQPDDWTFYELKINDTSIKKIELYGKYYDSTTIPSMTFRLCQGQIVSGTNLDNYNCTKTGQTLLREIIYPNPALIGVSTTTVQKVTIELSESEAIDTTKYYYFTFRDTNTSEWGTSNTFKTVHFQDGSLYSLGNVYYYDRSTPNDDFKGTIYKEVEESQATTSILNLTVQGTTPTVVNTYGEGFTVNNPMANAYWSSSNVITYSFTELARGSYLKIILQEDEYELNIDVNDSYDSNLLQYTELGLSGTFIASTTIINGEQGTQYYCIVLDSQYGEDYDLYQCGIRRDWYQIDTQGITELLEDSDWCDCSDIATTSDAWYDEITANLQCSARKTACWLFMPDDYNSLYSAIDKFKNGFPFGVFAQIKQTYDTAISTYGETEEEIVIAPLKWNGQETGANLLTNKTLEQGMGDYLYEKYYTWFKYIIYLLVLMYMVRRILKIRDNFDSRISKRDTEKEQYFRDVRNDWRARHTTTSNYFRKI